MAMPLPLPSAGLMTLPRTEVVEATTLTGGAPGAEATDREPAAV